MPHEGEADQLCTTPCISHGHTQLQRQTNQKELAHTSSSTAHPPAAIPHYPHGRFTSRMPTHRPFTTSWEALHSHPRRRRRRRRTLLSAWCSQVRRRRAPRGRLIQRVVDGAGDERRVRADVALDGEERERVLEGRFQELFELEVDRVVSKGVGLVVESGESSTLGQPEASS